MNRPELKRLMRAHGIRGEATAEALAMVLVDGKTAYEASQAIGLAQSVISRAKKRLARPLCPHCGQPMPGKGL